MLNFNYFLALVAMGTFVLLLVLEPFMFLASGVLSAALGLRPDEQNAKQLGYALVAAIWTVFLIVIWIRKKGLAPRAAKEGKNGKLVLGQLFVFAGHSLVLTMVIFPRPFAMLMILPILVIMALYIVGICLVELARDRRGPVLMRELPVADKRSIAPLKKRE
jgi:hypothetical protein